MMYLPLYSPDLTPIEESFSARESQTSHVIWSHPYLTVKSYIRRHGHELQQHGDPIQTLLEVAGCITAEKSYIWFKNAGCVVI